VKTGGLLFFGAIRWNGSSRQLFLRSLDGMMTVVNEYSSQNVLTGYREFFPKDNA
jgi:hypothetical protein